MRDEDEDDEKDLDPDDEPGESPEGPKAESGGKNFALTQLLKTRTLLLDEAITQESFRKFAEALLLLESVDATLPITLVVNTYGGREASAFATHDLIRCARAPIRTLANGVVGGVATLVYCAVARERRFSTPSSTFLLHQSSGGAGGAASDVEVGAAELQKVKNQVLTRLADAAGQSVERLDRDTRRKLTLDTRGAREYGLVGHIITRRTELAL